MPWIHDSSFHHLPAAQQVMPLEPRDYLECGKLVEKPLQGTRGKFHPECYEVFVADVCKYTKGKRNEPVRP